MIQKTLAWSRIVLIIYLYLYIQETIDTYMIIQDCFFVSVIIRNHPELHDKPVAVCHSDSAKGTAEISSANYPARDYGWFCSKLSI